MTAGVPPTNPDPLLEGRYARPRTFRDMAGGLVLGVAGFLLFLGIATIVVAIVK